MLLLHGNASRRVSAIRFRVSRHWPSPMRYAARRPPAHAGRTKTRSRSVPRRSLPPDRPAVRKSALAAMLRSILVKCAAKQEEYREENGDPNNAGRDAEGAAEAEAHRATVRSAR